MRSAIMMTVCLLALATMIEGSRRRLQAVHRRDDLEASDTNSSAGEIVTEGGCPRRLGRIRQHRQRPLLKFLPPPPQPSPATKHHWRSFDSRMAQCWWSVAATSWGHRLRCRSISLWLRLPLKRQYVSPWPMGDMTSGMSSAKTWSQLAVPLQRPRQFTLLQLHPP